MLCFFQETPATLEAFCVGEAEKQILEERNKNPEKFSLLGTHNSQKRYQLQFDHGELRVGKIDVEYMVLDVIFSVQTAAARVVSKFEVEGRGRVYTFQAQSADNPNLAIQIELVQVIPKK